MDKNDDFPITPTEMSAQVILAKCSYFVDVQLWPLHYVMDPKRWLENFRESEKEHAVYLLNSFLFFSEPLINEMLKAAFQALSRYVWKREDSLLRVQADWRSFVDSVIITHVTGEKPNITDSGYLFARKARQVLRIEEKQILSPENALQELVDHGPRPIVFVDDFVGSGNQFLDTWYRLYKLNNSVTLSFSKFAATRGSQFFYCPLLCTENGYKRLKTSCQEVKISPAHILSSRYSALNDDSIIWPSHLKSSAVDFLRQASHRAGIPDTGGAVVNDWQGFNRLGLAIGFTHSVPDATMPIFYWENNGWNPLIRRT